MHGAWTKRPSFGLASIEIDLEMKPPTIIDYAHALASGTRVYIFGLLGETGMSITDIASSTGLVPSTVSFHLPELSRVGLVSKRRKGRHVLYRWSSMRLSLKVEQVQPTTTAPTTSCP